jgi:hypothetical protein
VVRISYTSGGYAGLARRYAAALRLNDIRCSEFTRVTIERVMREPRLGVDIGRVIIDGSAHPDGGDTAFFAGDEQAMLATPEVPGAVDAIAALVPRFGGRVWLVSKCGPATEARTLRWLAAHEFFARTGIPSDHVRFCRERADKRIHCEELGLTHFVDDRPDVHAAIHDIVEHRYLFGSPEAPDWTVVRRAIEESLAG